MTLDFEQDSCRILLADDHDIYRNTIASLLERRGYQVMGVSCGDGVLAAAVERPFELFVLDYKMPGNEDLVLVEQLQALQPDVPVIVLTGFASLPSAMNAVRLQLFDYIQKDESPDRLLSRIDEAVRHTRLEKQLRTSEARYRLLAENIQDVITVFSIDGKAVYASPSIETVLGYRPDDFCGTDMYQLVHPEDHNGLERVMLRLREYGLINDHEARFRTRGGQYVWLGTSAKLLRNSSGDPQELVCSSRVIAERKKSQERLFRAAQEWQTTFDTTNDAILVLDERHRILRSNKTAESLFQCSRDGLIEQYCWKVVHGAEQPVEDCPVLRAKNSLRRETLEQQRDGKWFEVIADPVLDEVGKYAGAVHIISDITARRQAEERIRQLVQHLETVREEECKRLSRELHDDIGQILTALKIDLLLVEKECVCAGAVKQKITDMCKLLKEGIQSVHSLCRRLRPGALDDLGLKEAVVGLVDDWQRRTGIECRVDADIPDEDLPEIIRTCAFRIIQESLTNVFRHAHASRAEVRLIYERNRFCFFVADNGCGIAPDADKKPDSFGLLGMRERVEALNGELHIRSTPAGTTIEVTIPLPEVGRPGVKIFT